MPGGNDQRRYGFFKCQKCNRRWESSWAWCYRGTDNPSSGQECQTCKIMVKPYKVEQLIKSPRCTKCGEVTNLCNCSSDSDYDDDDDDDDDDERHVDPHKHHRSDLCERCKSGLPCCSR